MRLAQLLESDDARAKKFLLTVQQLLLDRDPSLELGKIKAAHDATDGSLIGYTFSVTIANDLRYDSAWFSASTHPSRRFDGNMGFIRAHAARGSFVDKIRSGNTPEELVSYFFTVIGHEA